MKDLLKKRYKVLIETLDKGCESFLENKDDGSKFIIEVPSNYCLYANYKDCHEQGYLTDGYNTDEEQDFIEELLAPLGYSELSESTYGWEAGEKPLFSAREIVKMLNQSKYVKAVTKCPFTTKEEEVKRGEERREIYGHLFSWTEQRMLESIEDALALHIEKVL